MGQDDADDDEEMLEYLQLIYSLMLPLLLITAHDA